MAIQVEVPTLGESVTQAILIAWHKNDGEQVAAGEPLCELETDKANVDVPSPGAGVLRRVKNEGDTVRVGEVIARIDPAGAASPAPQPQPAQTQPAAATVGAGVSAGGAGAPASIAPSTPGPAKSSGRTLDDLPPAARRLAEEQKVDPNSVAGTGRGGRVTKEDVQAAVDNRSGNGAGSSTAPSVTPPTRQDSPPPAPSSQPRQPQAGPQMGFDAHGERRVPMSKIRRRIAENLLRAQQTAAILTTFNEVDMSAVMDLRGKWKEQFEKVHGVGLGFMSFFARAVVQALREFPHVNAFLEGENIVYHQHVHLGIAVSTERGLAVPVLKNAETMSFARIEAEIKRLATATRDGKLSLDELSGGTFTITNGGVFGSLLSTPILNPPQSAILGMHAIQKRAVAINDKVEIRPMMYLALSYDHRMVDGKEAIGFLVRVKQLVEDPSRLMLEV
jgi:2-oxoglutarate dehydrogenase E2 component (dihydrolipoamide succinyltransferase)